jgi:hypothetical protein
MATIIKTYYFGHDIEIRDQVIMENVIKELHNLGIDTFVIIRTKKEDKNYISEIDILLDSNLDNGINEDDISYALENMKIKLLGGNYNGS